MAFSSKNYDCLHYLYDSNLLLYILLIGEIENPKTEDRELKTGIRMIT